MKVANLFDVQRTFGSKLPVKEINLFVLIMYRIVASLLMKCSFFLFHKIDRHFKCSLVLTS